MWTCVAPATPISDFSCVSSSISQGPLLLIHLAFLPTFHLAAVAGKHWLWSKDVSLLFNRNFHSVCPPKDTRKTMNRQNKISVFYASPLVFVSVLRVPDSWLPINLHTCLQLISLQSANLPVSLFIAKLFHLPCIVTRAKGRIGRLFYHLRLFCLTQVLRKKTTELISVGGRGNGTTENPLNLATYLNKGLCAGLFSISFNIPRYGLFAAF